VVAGDPGELRVQPLLQFCHQWRAPLLAGSESLCRVLAVDIALDREQGVELLHGLQRDRVDDRCLLTAALLACRTLDVGELEELPARVREATCLEDRARLATGNIQLTVAAIGIGLEDP